MSEFPEKTHFSSLIISDFCLFCTFILSHPLYFFYFIFFFPYLFKLVSFLSPLVFTTLLLLSVFLTFSHNDSDFSDSKLSFVAVAYQAVVERLKSKTNDNVKEETGQIEELEVFKIVFDTSQLEQHLAHYDPEIEIKETILTDSVVIPIGSELIEEEIGGQKGGKEEEEEEEEEEVKATVNEEQCLKRVSNAMECHLPKARSQQNPWKFAPIEEDRKQVKAAISEEQYLPRATSERVQQNPWSLDEIGRGEMFGTPKSMESSPSMRSNGSYGSMRKEKEWRRTLACKLFEERHNSDGSEGMDMLWETYERDSMKMEAKSRSKRGKKVESYDDLDEDEEDDEEEEGGNAGQLCCLQALKFSTGKMNLGMGKSNLVKISKAFKGVGWLHHVSKKKSCR